jgi:hypothetical protein
LTNPASSVITADGVKFIPKYIDLKNTPYLEATVELTDSNNDTLVEEINPVSVMLETIIPTATSIKLNKQGKPVLFVAEFSASSVKGMCWSILSHMGLTMPKTWQPLPLELTIRGALYNGTLWEGTGLVKIVNWDIVNPLP